MTTLQLIAPVTGTLLPVSQVPDPVFAEEMLGTGFAINPIEGVLYAPFDGVVKQLASTGHSITLVSSTGAEVLMHIGVDTVTLNGQGFKPQVALDQSVQAGDPLIHFDLAYLKKSVPSTLVIFVLLNSDEFKWHYDRVAPFNVSTPMPTGVYVGATLDHFPPTAQASAPSANPSTHVEVVAMVKHRNGLHARPAALVQKTAKLFASNIQLHYQSARANAKSTLDILMMSIPEHAHIMVSAEGTDAALAAAAMIDIIEHVDESKQAPDVIHDSSETLPAHTCSPLQDTACQGVVASRGVALGTIMHLRTEWPQFNETFVSVEHELQRLDDALASVKNELMASSHSSALKDIQAAHLSLLEDEVWQNLIRQAIRNQHTAGIAVRQETQTLMDQLERSALALFRERASDLKDLASQILNALAPAHNNPMDDTDWPDDVIVLADDIWPSTLSGHSKNKIRGMVTAKGGTTSHVSILARALSIPFIVALGESILKLKNGQIVIVDAEQGHLIVNPSDAEQAQAKQRMHELTLLKQNALRHAHQPAVTLDGHTIEVAANIAHTQDASEAMNNGADGIGLVRTELMFTDRQTMPNVQEQQAHYQAIVDTMVDKPVIIRTLDIGADKELSYVSMPKEENPSLGLRGVRLGLARTEMLDAQLEALLHVKPTRSCRIMLPMISDVSEVKQVRERLVHIATQLGLTDLPELGVMIEVPSAALLADQLSEHVDFFSVGTNDLTQYVLAMDRCQPELASRLDGLHPAVLRMIQIATQGAAKHNKWVGVCGALAEEPLAIPLLIGLGITELSVGAANVPHIKTQVRRLDLAACQTLVKTCLTLHSAQDVRQNVHAFLASLEGG
ncbi:Phosphoenolpyruvate-protein phosphotransferase [Ephemeroptericola cinctiostellae]|uniref:phosphoenolpyruvate--protein phosphotransferase n=1 Tax=Ephemeroptericola cinctiostellae TaxID=2268024 RepID=A0A345DAY4_9BURK|nr:phosphoenolpyruvate--protein phosphotransferase [Ephemeroptericola cinctiostellae]AXF85522.1 Phosphoenolpyruvate-protein phosphotransferase [Ephemeroptericola cinctiostellae]